MDSPKLTPVSPARPPAAYLGGKRNLAKRICAILDRVDCKTYAEPFVGMGGIFLRRTRRPTSEVINERGRDVANLFRTPPPGGIVCARIAGVEAPLRGRASMQEVSIIGLD